MRQCEKDIVHMLYPWFLFFPLDIAIDRNKRIDIDDFHYGRIVGKLDRHLRGGEK